MAQPTIDEVKEKVFNGEINRVKLTELRRHIGLLLGPKPFLVVSEGVVVAEVVEPGTKWYSCENCGENTKECIQFESEKGWEMLILCDKCNKSLLK